MRLFFGIILGVLLTIGAAYIVDSTTPPPGPGETTVDTQMVNWNVVQRRFSDLGTNVREAWNRLTGAPGAPAKSGT